MTVAHNTYQKREEILNVITHGLGAILSIPAFIVLMVLSYQKGDIPNMMIYMVYGISLMVLYFSSTLYHGVQNPKWRNPLNVWDHISIYLLIAGSYGPFVLIGLEGTTMGWVIFGIVWAFAIVGIIIKIFYFGKYAILSAIAYVIMGWVAIIGINTMLEMLPIEAIYWLFGGGIAYTVGAVLFMFDNKIPYNHAIFHIFVLIGSACHYYAVYTYLLTA
ncbi:MAG: hemolysin III family protein [Bacteroidales bacterium]|nr:hemolysin III family protein [Bacteroidales bacterium]